MNPRDARDVVIRALDACLEKMTPPNRWVLLQDLAIDIDQRTAWVQDTEPPDIDEKGFRRG